MDVPDIWRIALGYSTDETPPKRRRGKAKRDPKPKTKRPPASRLNADDARDVKEYFCYFEGNCGLRSTWPEQVDALRSRTNRTIYKDGVCVECGCKHAMGARHEANIIQERGIHSNGEPSYDMNLLGIATSRELESANRVRDALVEMVERGWQDSVRHLWRVYGPQNCFYPFSRFGDLAQLVDQTPLADRLAKEFELPHRDALERRLRMEGADLVSERLRDLAEKMLCLAAERYRQCRPR